MNQRVPAAVRRQADRAAKLQEQMTGVPPEGEGKGEGQGEGQGEGEGEGQGQTSQEGQQQAQQQTQEGQGGGQQVQEGQPAQEGQQAQEPDWKQRYETLQGKYNAEVPTLSRQNRELRQHIEQLNERMAQIEQQHQQTSQKNSLVSDNEIEEHGEEFVDFIRRVARGEAAREVGEVTPKIQQIEGQFRKTQAQTAQQAVHSRLSQEIPDWQQVNNDPGFHSWLSVTDPFAGQQRQQMLTEAYNRGDADRVAAFFRAYKAETNAVAPGQEPPKKTGKKDLADLAGPSGGNMGGDSSREEPSKKIWTRAEIKKFYDDVQRGTDKRKPSEKDKIEGEIGKAMREGRIAE